MTLGPPVHLLSGEAPPRLARPGPFKAIVVVEDNVTPEWRPAATFSASASLVGPTLGGSRLWKSKVVTAEAGAMMELNTFQITTRKIAEDVIAKAGEAAHFEITGGPNEYGIKFTVSAASDNLRADEKDRLGH